MRQGTVKKAEVLSAFSSSFIAGETSLQESQDLENPNITQGKKGFLEKD